MKILGLFGIFVLFLSFLSLSSAYAESEIPDWARNIATWWGVGEISDDEFKNAIQFLVEQQIIQVELPNDSGINLLTILDILVAEPKITLDKDCYDVKESMIIEVFEISIVWNFYYMLH